jgi:hypothetical protein
MTRWLSNNSKKIPCHFFTACLLLLLACVCSSESERWDAMMWRRRAEWQPLTVGRVGSFKVVQEGEDH